MDNRERSWPRTRIWHGKGLKIFTSELWGARISQFYRNFLNKWAYTGIKRTSKLSVPASTWWVGSSLWPRNTFSNTSQKSTPKPLIKFFHHHIVTKFIIEISSQDLFLQTSTVIWLLRPQRSSGNCHRHFTQKNEETSKKRLWTWNMSPLQFYIFRFPCFEFTRTKFLSMMV